MGVLVSESVGSSRGRARVALWGVVVVGVAAAVVAGLVLTHRSTPSSRWWVEWGSPDAAAVNQDNYGTAGVIAGGPGLSALALHQDCQIGARDLARILGQPSSPDATFRRAYRVALERDARAYRTCLSMTIPTATASVTAAVAGLRHDFRLFDDAIGPVNDRARRLGYGLVFTPAR